MRMNTTTSTTTPIILSKFISDKKEMLAFVFCLHAHLKRFLSIITLAVSHIENVHKKIYTYSTQRDGERHQNTHIHKTA